ncbi:MAG: NADH-quinone oxidoreductase subunit C [Methanotrichaceae archaeon]|nr:NADH-quinone oxidoreductase subunit C [Methanotrichaceae archaeon]
MTTASEVLSSLQSAFPGAIKDPRVESDARLWATVDPKRIYDVCKYLTDKLNFDHYSGSAGVDWIANNEMEVVEIMASHGAHPVVAMLKVRTPRDNPSIKSLTGLYWNADWYEREIWEMFGINFENHSGLYPLLLSDELMGVWPWRKDFKGYPDLTTGQRAVALPTANGYTEFRIPPTPAEIEAGTVPKERPKYPSFREREEAEIKSDSEMIMHLGPQHAMVPGPFLLDILVEGERVRKGFLDVGYIHKGIEKIMENRTWLQGITYTDRMCYVASLSNNECYCGAVEKILGLEVPERAQYIRVIVEELSRIQSHLIGTGEFLTLIAGVGYAPWQYMIIDREHVISLIESVTGARLTHSFVRFGGVRNDLPDDFAEKCKITLPYIKSRINEFIELFAQDPIYDLRMKDVGVLPAETAKEVGIAGPALRASGVSYDMRVEDPILVYPDLDFKVITGTKGDCADRIDVRLREILESIYIIEQCLDRIPSGPIKPEAKVPKKVPAGEAYYRVEDPRGEMGMYVISDGGDKPYRVKVRGPFYATLQTLPPLLEGVYVADVVAIAGSMDGCPSEADR